MLKIARVIVFVIVLLTLHFTLSTKSALAQGEFETDYKVTYAVDTSGKTTVNEQIILKNKTANYYADKFELKIGSTKVENVKAQDATGDLATNVQFQNNITTISVKFNQRVIGLGKTLPWNLSYSSQELATKSGQIWEVSIPRLAKSSEIGIYDAQVIVPSAFGPVAFALPNPQSQSRQSTSQIFNFNKDQLLSSGISMSFGTRQVFEFTLTYFLENSNLTTQIDTIPIPPDNNYQKVVLETIEPKPQDVTVDGDGNFLARYRLPPKKQIDVTVKGYVEVFSKPFRKLDDDLSEENKKKYLVPQRYWELDAAQIKEKAKELKTSQAIYNFVADFLTYKEEKLTQKDIERLGALAALNSPKEAVCMEFTDLFIALARSAGIPAREVVGYAYTQNTRLRPLSFETEGDLLHAWPEYWDENLGWVQIDPTWGSTSGGLDYFNKLDFNHITLIQRGLSSQTPYPPGSYKKASETEKKDVNFSFSQELPQIFATPQLTLEISEKIIAGVPARAKVIVENTGSASIPKAQLKLEADYLKSTSQNPLDLGILPPFAKREIVFNLSSKNFLKTENDTLVASYNETQISRPVIIVPFYYLIISPAFIIIVLIASCIIATGLILYNKIHKKKLKIPSDFM